MTLTGRAQAPSSLSLEEAIAAGLEHHPRVLASEASVEQARAAVLQAKVAERPTLSAAEDMTYSNDPVFVFGSKLRQGSFGLSDFDLPNLNHPAALANFSASVTATWTAFDAGSAHRNLQSVRSTLSAAEFSREYTNEELRTEITKLYFRVLLAQDQVAVAETSLNRAQELSSDVEDRVRSGLSLESDSMRSTLARRRAEDDVAAAHSNIELARRDLFDAIDEPDSTRALVRPDSEIHSPEGHANQASGGLASRLDLQAIRQQESAAKSSRASVKATAWPRFTTYAHVENDAEDVVRNGSGSWTIAAKLELPIFDGGLRKAREQEADARLHSLQAEELETLLSARSKIAGLQNQIADLTRRYSTAQNAVRVEQEALQTARDRYAAGLASLSDVLINESELSTAEFDRVRVFYQLQIVDADLRFATGSSSTSKAGQP